MSRHLPPRQAGRCRRRFRTTTTGRTRTPSTGSTWALRLKWPRPRLLFTRVASPRTLSLAASPRNALAARCGIFVRHRFWSMGRTVRAAGFLRPVARLLTVEASTRVRAGAARSTLPRGLRRPPTSRAHRLRKPDHTSELLTPSVAQWSRGHGLRPGPSGDGPHTTTAPLYGRHGQEPPSRQIRRCCRRFRTTATSEIRAPSVGSSRTLRPGRALLRSLFTRTASPRTLSLAASLGPPRQRPPGRLKLSLAPRPGRACAHLSWCDEKDAPHRLLQPTPFTSTLQIAVFPAAPRAAPALRRIAIRIARAHPGPEPSGTRSWGDPVPAFPVSQPDGANA